MRETTGEVCRHLKQELASFRYLERADLVDLTPLFSCRQVAAGEILWREGDPCDYLVFIVEGRIEVKKETEFQGKQVIVGVYGRGTVVGELCILDNAPRPVTAVALEDSSLLVIDRADFIRLLEEEPELGVKLLKGMLFAVSSRLRKSFDRLASIF